MLSTILCWFVSPNPFVSCFVLYLILFPRFSSVSIFFLFLLLVAISVLSWIVSILAGRSFCVGSNMLK